MRLLFSPQSRASRIQFLLILLGATLLEIFLVQLVEDARANLDQANFFALLCGATLPCAWVQMCAVLGRLRDLRWPWMIALPWLPVVLWPLWRLLPAGASEEIEVGLASYCAGAGVLLIFWKGEAGAKTQTPSKPKPDPEKEQPVSLPPAGGMYTRCSNGHFYTSQLKDCPYCPSTAPAAPPALDPQLLVGWLVVVEGPGKGAEYRLYGTRSRIATSQAEIVYDSDQNSYTLAPAGAPVERNGAAVPAPVALKSHDRIRLGDAILIFVPFCTYHRWMQGWVQSGVQGGAMAATGGSSPGGAPVPMPGRAEQKRAV